MSTNGLIVLKFGGSILKGPQDVHRAALEIYRWRRDGYQVIAVVSAIGNATDQLTELTNSFGDAVDPQKTALLLATGELQSASLTGLALDRAGISSFVCDDASIGLRTSGPVLDASLTGVDTCLLRNKLDQRGVVVLPGFVGRGETGELTLLGRGGSDLTALFVAERLGGRCRLIKDVDGLYEFDPKLDRTPPRRFETLNYEDALSLDESIVQHKAVRFARDKQLAFEVSTISADHQTQVGGFPASSLTVTCFGNSGDPAEVVRVALIGLGTVGFGVYRQIVELWEDKLEIVAVSVRDWRKAIRNGVSADLIANSAEEAVNSDCDVVVELVGGDERPLHWITAALQQGKHVVTANKSLLARESIALEKLAIENGVTISFSAAVGGSVPVLERVEEIAGTESVVEVVGILNGSINFLLNEIDAGSDFDVAIEKAHESGLTEKDPSRDLAGIDAAEKLVLVARECGYEISPEDIPCQELTARILQEFDRSSGHVLRQIGRLTFVDGNVLGHVTLQAVEPKSVFAQVKGCGNLIEITRQSGQVETLRGAGAGRWPTTLSVISDLLALQSRVRLLLAATAI